MVPVTFDNLATGHRWAVQWGPLVEGDTRDRTALERVIGDHAPVAVIHLAALSVIDESVREPRLYHAVNVGGTENLLAAMRVHGVVDVVLSSTASVYGEAQNQPISEDAPEDPINPYGATKLAAEALLRDHAPGDGLRATALRYFNAAGATESIGEAHDPETHLFPLAIFAALGRRPALTIHGTDYPTPDGTCIRDYVHVADLAEAHVAALDRPQSGFRIFNLGTGAGLSVRQVLDAVKTVSGRTMMETSGPRRPGDAPILVAAANRAKAALGWSPHHSSPEEIAASAWQWHAGGGAGQR